LPHRSLLSITLILGLGVLAQWLAWRLRLPSILWLLLFGFLAGPATGVLQPDLWLGDLIEPVMNISVAAILYEGGLSLKLHELRQVGGVVHRLVTLGSLLTWLLVAAAAHLVLGLPTDVALLLGAVLSVTGPTVIGPLLEHVRPARHLGWILKWEGILIDPVGATLGILVFEALMVGHSHAEFLPAALEFVEILAAGAVCGLGGALFLTLVLHRFWVPDALHNALSLTVLVGSFTAATALHQEAGLFAATVLGLALANQRRVDVRHLVEFSESLRVLVLGSLFVLLAARLPLSDLVLTWNRLLFVALLMLLVRPATVALCTLGSNLSWRERVFLGSLAPRGIIAAATASIFSAGLLATGHPGADQLVPVTFQVIVLTVALYGLGAAPLARRLGLAQPPRQGSLILGADPVARALARPLHEAGHPVLLVDIHSQHVQAARAEGLRALLTSAFTDEVRELAEREGLLNLLCLTPSDSVNTEGVHHFVDWFGRKNVFRLPSPLAAEGRTSAIPGGRVLFDPGATHAALARRLEEGEQVLCTVLEAPSHYRRLAGQGGVLPLFVLDGPHVDFIAAGSPVPAQKGERLVFLGRPGSAAAL
jgi:NhaP-type Na+/H+ or K+/H+ antiporter